MILLHFRDLRIFIILFFVLLWTMIALYPSLNCDFVNWDDPAHLYENDLVKSLDFSNIRKIFQTRVNGTYIPLTILSFAVEYHFLKDEPFIYHLNNLILHLMNVALIFWLALRLGLSRWAAGGASLLFGIHPMHVESVAWITERKDVLYSLFYLLSLHCYFFYVQGQQNQKYSKIQRKILFYGFSIFTFLLSLLAKPMAISLPLILFLFDWLLQRKFRKLILLEKLPFFLLAISIGWMTYSIFIRIPGKDVLSGLCIWSWSLAFYVQQFLFPTFLTPIYHTPWPLESSYPIYFFSVVLVIALGVAIVYWRKHRWFVFALGFYLLSIFFLLRFDDRLDVNVVADRFMYLPSLGFCLLIGYWIERLIENAGNDHWVEKGAIYLGFLTVLMTLSFKTLAQCQIWGNSITLWTYQISISPVEEIAFNNLANAYRAKVPFQEFYKKDQKRQQRIRKETPKEGKDIAELSGKAFLQHLIYLYKRAMKLEHDYLPAYYNLGYLYQDIGEYKKAIEVYQDMLSLDPFDYEIHFYLGESYQELGQTRPAILHYLNSILLAPAYEEMYIKVILAFNKAINDEQPDRDLYQAMRSRIFNIYKEFSKEKKAADYFHLANIFKKEQRGEEALIALYQKAKEMNSQYTEAYFDLKNFVSSPQVHWEIISREQKDIPVENIGHLQERRFRY